VLKRVKHQHRWFLIDIFNRLNIYLFLLLMIFKRFVFAFLLLISVSLAAFAQNDTIPLASLILKTQKYVSSFPTEKVYLHFDKPYYAVGDTIWFKAYITVDQHQLSALSKIVYVDLINNRDSVIRSLRLPVVNGASAGNIVLPQESFIEGNYHVRSYTAWMRNFDPAYFFTKNIVVGNIVDKDNPVDTHVTFTNEVKSDAETIKAHVVYKDQDNIAYINKKVSWKVQNDDETIDRGKGTTDLNGGLDISFSSNKPGIFATSVLTTQIELNNKKTITNTFSLKTAAIARDVQFLPEGGNMLIGVRAKVAFKAINSKGLGIDIKGTLVDNTGNVVANFASQHLGMGVFAFTPEAGKTYKANVTFPDGAQNSYSLPRALDEGIDLTLNNSQPDSLQLKIASNSDFVEKFSNTRFYIVAQSGGIIYYAAQTNLKSLVYNAAIPKAKFPTGILQVSLLSSEGDPLSERIAFIQHNDMLNIAVNTDRPAYTQRQKVRMVLSAKNKELPVIGNFSVSVTDETKTPYNDDDGTTILSSLFLTSDLKGYIEKPNYYFNHVDSIRLANLDLLMLTQGYTRFNYSDIVADKFPQLFYYPEQGITILGTLRTNTGIAVAGGNVHLTIPDKIFATDAITDVSGNFVFPKLQLQDSSALILNAKNNVNGKSMVLTVNEETFPALLKNVNAPENVVNIDSTFSTYLQNIKRQYSGTRVLKEVVIKAVIQVKKPSHSDYSSLSGLSVEPDHIVHSDQLQGCNDLLECLKGTVFGFTFDVQNFYVTRDYNAGNKNTPAAVYYNGMPVDASYLQNIPPSSVESVEVFLNDGLSGVNKITNTKGVIVINSKKVDKGQKISLSQLKDLIPKYNVITINPLGYQKPHQFYVPKYAVTKVNPNQPDLRTTIYWNPQIITDNSGKAAMEFYNADGKGYYRVVIEGIDGDGVLAHFVFHYKVE
jgi:hypothetical protein